MAENFATKKKKTFLFGTYPQRREFDEDLIRRLNEKAGALPTEKNAENWTPYPFYYKDLLKRYCWHIDLTEGDRKYRGVYFTEWRPILTCDDGYLTTRNGNRLNLTAQNDNGYDKKTIYWFRYDPIKWFVLFHGDELALLLSSRILSSNDYFHAKKQDDVEVLMQCGPIDANSYCACDLRDFLLSHFYKEAFTEEERKRIVKADVVNDEQSTFPSDRKYRVGCKKNPYACVNTEDSLFALSLEEVTDKFVGFEADLASEDPLRQKMPTDYAQAMGAKTILDDCVFKGYGLWWLRSPEKDSEVKARFVMPDGSIQKDNGLVYRTDFGVVPALWIKLKQ